MLTGADLKKLVAAGAGVRIDVLSPAAATPERIARSLVALANTKGGVLIVDLGSVPSRRTGIDPDELRDRAMQALLMSEPHLIVPMPYLLRSSPDAPPDALVVEVPDGMPHVYSLDGRYLARSATRNVALPSRALRELMLERTEDAREWESKSPPGCAVDDLDWARVESYAAATQSTTEPTVEEVLLRRGCVVRQGRRLKPTYAGLLLFGKQPQRWVRGAEVLAVRFAGTVMDDAFTRQTIGGTLPDQIRRTELFISENLVIRSRIGRWQRNEEPPFPPGVLREAVVNAIAHRDYRLIGSQIHVLMFNDRVEVRSPGGLPGHVTLKNLLHERYSRNEAVVQVLADMGYIERLGYGIDRMMRLMKDRGQAPPKFEETDGGFVVTLYARNAGAPHDAGAPASAQQQRLDQMLAFLKTNGRITNRDYQELCPGVSPESLRRDFVDMVERGVILRVGDKRGTYYIMK